MKSKTTPPFRRMILILLLLTAYLTGHTQITILVEQDQVISCHGNSDGSASAAGGGGLAPYSYSVDGGLYNNFTGFFINLSPGTHTICTKDANGQTACGTVSFEDPEALGIDFTEDSVISCHGGDGALTANITGGTNILQGYLTVWTNAAGDTLNDLLTNNFALSLLNLSEDTYNVLVEDDHGCFFNQSYVFAAAAPIEVNVSYSPIPCPGGMTTLDLTATGGVPYEPITFLVNGAPMSPAYPAGNYTITATDAKGCTGAAILVLSDGSSLPTVQTVTACESYNWSVDNMTYTSSGIYTQTLSNAGGCNYVLTLDLTIHHHTSNSSTVSASNLYTWPFNGVTYTLSGTYTANSINAEGCVHTETLILLLSVANNLSLSLIENQGISCFGNNDGSADAIVTGTGPFHFSVDGGPFIITSYTFSGLSVGSHTICVKDNLNNVACASISFADPDPLSIVFEVDSIVSCLGNDGSLSAHISGGSNLLQGYLTVWTNANGDTMNDLLTNNFALNIEGLQAGVYNVLVEDDHGCFFDMDGLLPSAPPIVVNASYTAVTCQGAEISVNATGGAAYQPLTYLVNGLPLVSNYPAGTYTIVAADAKGCTGSTLLVIPNSTLSVTTTLNATACNAYTWSVTNTTYTNSGTYSATFTGANGCDSILQLLLMIHTDTHNGDAVVSSCGSYTWYGITYSTSGIYSHTSFNASGCLNTATLSLTVITNPVMAGSISANETGCAPGYDPAIIVSDAMPSGGSGVSEFAWFKSTDGGVTSNLISGAAGSSFDPGVISQTTWYRRGARTTGCTDYTVFTNWVIKQVVNTPSVNITSSAGSSGICSGSQVTLTAAGATDFVWSNGSSSASINVTPLSTTSYTVTGTTDGCSSTASITVVAASCADSVCWGNSSNPEVKASTSWSISGSTVIIRTTLSKQFVDNTYGANAIGWQSGHSFNDLVGGDRLQLALYDASNVKKLEFKMDYISASSSAPSGYKSLGVTGGDGNMMTGSAANIVSVKTSLDVNLNQSGYILTSNSPATNSNYSSNPSYPNWIYDVWYEVTVNLSAFGANGFGHPGITSLYASPNKSGSNTQQVSQVACPCNNYITNGGTIGNDETVCGTSMNPANIVNLSLPSGGVGALEYRWSSSTNNGATSTVIAGATDASYDPGVITQTTWYLRAARHIGCTGFDSSSNWVKKELTICPPTYGSPASYSSTNEFINKVVFNTINNLSGNNNGYGDFSAMSTTVWKGTTIPITLMPGFSGPSAKEYWKVWIDWNYDGDWSDNGELVAKENWNGTSSKNIDIEIPNSAVTGYPLRMRVIMRRSSYAASAISAGSNDKGEVEDYTVVVAPGYARTSEGPGETVQINTHAVDPISMVRLYPNPVSSDQHEINLQYNLIHSGEVEISIYSIDGRLLHTQSVNSLEGSNETSVNLQNLSAGMYNIIVTFDQVRQTQKLIIR